VPAFRVIWITLFLNQVTFVLSKLEKGFWHPGNAYVTFSGVGKMGLFADSVDLSKLEPIFQILFFVAGILFTLTYSQVKAAMESGMIISIKAMTYKLRCLERKSKSMTAHEVSECGEIPALFASVPPLIFLCSVKTF